MNTGYFLDYSYDAIDIVMEGKKWNKLDRKMYQQMRKVQTSKLGLLNSYMSQKKLCEKKLKEANSTDMLDTFSAWLDKQESLIQRKINGTEIKDKKALQKFISLYKEYHGKIKSKQTQLITAGNESFYVFDYDPDDVATEGLKEFSKGIWITIKNVFNKIITWLKNLLLNINYFKNAELDEKMNKDLLHVLKVSQPRTEDNYKVLVKFYSFFKKTGNVNREFNGTQTGVASTIPTYAITNLAEEINKSISDLDDSLNAARNSEEYKRIMDDKYENANLKIVPLTNIIPDMKNSQTACTNYTGHVEKIENAVSRVDNPDGTTKRIIVLLNKIVSYYTFRINLLTKYFTKAKASLKGTLNNIKNRNDEDSKSKTSTKIGKMKLKVSLSPEKTKQAKAEYEECLNAETYSEYKPHYDKLTSLLNLQGANIEALTFSGNMAMVVAIKHKEEKIPVKGRTLYHTSTGQENLTELKPSFKTLSGVLFPEPRVYVHIGVPLNRYANKVDTEGGFFKPSEASYIITDNISEVYRDPEMGKTAAYIKTTNPIKIKKLDIKKFNENRDKDIDLTFSKKG